VSLALPGRINKGDVLLGKAALIFLVFVFSLSQETRHFYAFDSKVSTKDFLISKLLHW